MAKFFIECPSCGRYVEGSSGLFSTGLFGKNKIKCSCGNVVNVRTDKLASKQCAHCGNTVVYDQSKGDKALCPVCHEPINTREDKNQYLEFTCPSCACSLTAAKSAASYDCPLCGVKIDVQERLKQEEIKKKGLASVIKYEGGNDVFVWKHPIEDFNLGSQLIVHESQEAIFFRDGKALDLFGSGRYTLATQNIPLLQELYKLPFNPETVFHSEVYFINMTTQMGIKWGTDSKVRFFDPASGLHIEIGACGQFNLRVCDSRKLIVKLVGTMSELRQTEIMGVDLHGVSASGNSQSATIELYSINVVVGKFKALIMNRVKSNLARIIKENNINILEIDEHIDEISEKMCVEINETLEEYGLTMPEFYITTINTPDDDPNFKALKQQFAEKTLKVRQEEILKAEAEAAQQRKIVEAQTAAQLELIGAQAKAEAYKAQAYAEAEEMRAKGYTYQQETARQVGMEAMKNGITGGEGGGGSALGDIAGLGVTLGAMGSVIGMTKDALNPVMTNAAGFGESVMTATAADTWACTCGTANITSKFCPNCGTKKPEPVLPGSWDCLCGKTGITSNFCPECGAKKPAPAGGWTCPDCGKTDITSKFCPECGCKKGEE